MSPVVELITHQELTTHHGRSNRRIYQRQRPDITRGIMGCLVPPIFQWRQDAPNMVTARLEHVTICEFTLADMFKEQMICKNKTVNTTINRPSL